MYRHRMKKKEQFVKSNILLPEMCMARFVILSGGDLAHFRQNLEAVFLLLLRAYLCFREHRVCAIIKQEKVK